MFLDAGDCSVGHNPTRLLHQHVGRGNRHKNTPNHPVPAPAQNQQKTAEPGTGHFSICAGVAGVPIYLHPALLCTSSYTKLLIIVWDLLLIQGSVVLFKATLILLDYMEPIIE